MEFLCRECILFNKCSDLCDNLPSGDSVSYLLEDGICPDCGDQMIPPNPYNTHISCIKCKHGFELRSGWKRTCSVKMKNPYMDHLTKAFNIAILNPHAGVRNTTA